MMIKHFSCPLVKGYLASFALTMSVVTAEASDFHSHASGLNARDGLAYVLIEPGSFQMGCIADDPECRDDEKPMREQTITSAYWMSSTEVTVAAFTRFVVATDHITTAEHKGFGGFLTKVSWENREGANWRVPGFEQQADHPVVLTSWHDAHAFCTWTGGRLPTEIEWAYAAQGGRQNVRYVWGNSPLPLVAGKPYANVADQSAFNRSLPAFELDYMDGAAYTSPVGSYEPNAYGLYDMAGNVLEWCADSDPTGKHLARGGAWNNPPHMVRISRRSRFAPAATLSILGFRCVRERPPDSG